MALENLGNAGDGGQGFHRGSRPGTAEAVLKELQGFNVAVLAGTTADTKIDVAAIRDTDTVLSCIEVAATTAACTDRTANTTISSVKATGTLTFVSTVENDTFTINGVTFTVKDTANLDGKYTTVETGGTDNAMAANAATAINSYFSVPGTTTPVTAVANTNVVTLTATVDGPGSGPIVTETGTTITVDSTDPGSVTATCVSVVEDEALTVNGVTFTAKNTPSGELEVDVGASDTIMAENFRDAINAYMDSYNNLDVVATAASGVVTIVAKSGRTGNSVTLAETGTTITASGAYLAGGTNTGGIEVDVDTSTDSLILMWYNKS